MRFYNLMAHRKSLRLQPTIRNSQQRFTFKKINKTETCCEGKRVKRSNKGIRFKSANRQGR